MNDSEWAELQGLWKSSPQRAELLDPKAKEGSR